MVVVVVVGVVVVVVVVVVVALQFGLSHGKACPPTLQNLPKHLFSM